jgi:hypothetical protein
MMGAKDVSAWFAEDNQRAARAAEFREQEAQKRMQESKAKREASLVTQVASVENEIAELGAKLATMPPVYIHNRFDLTAKRRMKLLLKRFDTVECFLATGFNPALLKFGSSWFTVVSLVASMALGFQYLQSHFGIDAVGGSEVATVLVAVGVTVVLDLVSFMLLGGFLGGLRIFCSRQQHASLLAKTIVFSSLLGLSGFLIVLYVRLSEVAI